MRAPSSSTIWIGRIGKGQNSVHTKPRAIPHPAMTYMIARVLFFQYNLVKCQPGSRLQDIMTQLSAPTLTPIPHPIEHLHSDLLHPLFRPFHTVKSRIYHPAPPFWIPIILFKPSSNPRSENWVSVLERSLCPTSIPFSMQWVLSKPRKMNMIGSV